MPARGNRPEYEENRPRDHPKPQPPTRLSHRARPRAPTIPDNHRPAGRKNKTPPQSDGVCQRSEAGENPPHSDFVADAESAPVSASDDDRRRHIHHHDEHTTAHVAAIALTQIGLWLAPAGPHTRNVNTSAVAPL